MITKEVLLGSIEHESNVCKHLHGKLAPEMVDYRPNQAQRSTMELLRYLSIVNIAATRGMMTGDWSIWRQYSENAKEMTFEEFPAAMDRQMAELREFLAPISEEEMSARTLRTPMGQELPLNIGLMNTILKWSTAYKMQLFLYAKSDGRTDITTYDCWGGIDTPVKEEVPAEEASTEEVA